MTEAPQSLVIEVNSPPPEFMQEAAPPKENYDVASFVRYIFPIVFLLAITIVAMMLTSPYGDTWEDHEILMVKESGTEYTAEFEMEEGWEIVMVSTDDGTFNGDAEWSQYGHNFSDYSSNPPSQVGNWNRSNSTMIIDDGVDRGDSFTVRVETSWDFSEPLPIEYEIASSLGSGFCLITGIYSLTLISSAKGEKAKRDAGIVSLITLPIFSFIVENLMI